MADTALPADAHQLRDLALTIHDLSWRIARFGPAQAGVTPLPTSELAVLRAVMDHPHRSVSDVAQALSMQISNVSTALRSLIERGLVAKCADDQDRRVSLLAPTPRALAEREQIENAIAATVTTALGAIDDEHRRALSAALPAIRALTEQVGSAAWQL